MYTDDINEYLNEQEHKELDILELNNLKMAYSDEIYDKDEDNLLLTSYIIKKDLKSINHLVKQENDIEVLLEMVSRLNTNSFVNDELKDNIYNKYQELITKLDPDLALDVFEEILSYSFSSPLNGNTYYLLDLYDRMILNSFKDQDYTKFKAKAIKDLRKANLGKEVNDYLDKIIKTL